jgi:hypothetical protein
MRHPSIEASHGIQHKANSKEVDAVVNKNTEGAEVSLACKFLSSLLRRDVCVPVRQSDGAVLASLFDCVISLPFG